MATAPDPLPMLHPATADDFEFTHDLTRANMEAYVIRHFGGWNRDIYTENYNKGWNFVVWASDTRVGYVRLLPQPPIMMLDDFQVASSHQGRGFGSFLLTHLGEFLLKAGFTRLRLRVYHENPARNLYLRAGFHEVERRVGTSILEKVLTDGAPPADSDQVVPTP